MIRTTSLILSPIVNSTFRIITAPNKLQLSPGTVLERYTLIDGKIVITLDRPLTSTEDKLLFEKLLLCYKANKKKEQTKNGSICINKDN